MEFRYTEDGTPALFHPGYGEAYHPRQGALLQARRLYLEKTRTHLHPVPRVLEVGLGLMVNFRVALESALARGSSSGTWRWRRSPCPGRSWPPSASLCPWGRGSLGKS